MHGCGGVNWVKCRIFSGFIELRYCSVIFTFYVLCRNLAAVHYVLLASFSLLSVYQYVGLLLY